MITTTTAGHRLLVARRVREMQARTADHLTRLLAGFFRAQAQRVVDRLGAQKAHAGYEQKAAAEELLPEEERRRLQALILPVLSEAFLASAELAADLAGLEEAPMEPTDPEVLRFLADAGVQITQIHAATLAEVRQILQAGHLAGYSDWQIAHGVEADGFRGLRSAVTETYSGRAQTIARTEVGRASALGSVARYQAARVAEVDVLDGEGCGWTFHDDPDEADGSRRTLVEAEATPLSHPNCVRVFLPVLDR